MRDLGALNTLDSSFESIILAPRPIKVLDTYLLLVDINVMNLSPHFAQLEEHNAKVTLNILRS